MSIVDLKASRATPLRDLASAFVGRHDRSFLRGVQRVADLLLIWHQRSQQRRQLQTLSDHMLRDIGLTRADVLAESSKPFWRV
jgi:uncharacterized protein YjiS (DUF1127 family)